MSKTLKNMAKGAFKAFGKPFTSESNESTVNIVVPNVTMLKANAPSIAVVGQTISFTITVTNDGAAEVTDFVLVDDLIAAGYTFVIGSAKINGVATPQSPIAGITLGSIGPSVTVIITFDATVNAI